MKKTAMPILLSIVLIIVVFGAFVQLGVVLRDWSLYRASRTWPGVMGVVTESKLLTLSSSEGIEYKPVIVYQYDVRGQRYESRIVMFGSGGGPPTFYNQSGAESLVAKYPAGSKVTVYYNPDRPGLDSVLEREYQPDLALTALSGLIAIVSVLFGSAKVLHLGKRSYSKRQGRPPL